MVVDHDLRILCRLIAKKRKVCTVSKLIARLLACTTDDELERLVHDRER